MEKPQKPEPNRRKKKSDEVDTGGRNNDVHRLNFLLAILPRLMNVPGRFQYITRQKGGGGVNLPDHIPEVCGGGGRHSSQ